MAFQRALPSVPPSGNGAARCWRDPHLLALEVYRLIALPFRLVKLVHHCATKKRWFEMSLTRLSIPHVTPENAVTRGTHVVFVGTGFGECKIMSRVTDELKKLEDCSVSWALRDPVCVDNVRKTRPGQNIEVFPFESLLACTRWLKRVRPDVVVFVERFRFPCLAACAKHYGATVAVVNGRSRDRSDAKHRLFGFHYRWTFKHYDAFAMQDEVAARTLSPWVRSDAKVTHIGNIKFEVDPSSIDPAVVASLDEWLKRDDLPIVAAGSSQNAAEEEFIVDAFLQARSRRPMRLLLAPRRIERANEVDAVCKARGVSVSHRSLNEGKADVFVLDTIGELAAAYQFCKGAYVGGSLFGDGHNILEPVVYGQPVAYGPKRGFFGDIQFLCEKMGVGFRLNTREELSEFWVNSVCDSEFCRGALERAVQEVKSRGGASRDTAEMLAPLVSQRSRAH